MASTNTTTKNEAAAAEQDSGAHHDEDYALLRDASGDLLLSIVSFLNVQEGNRFAATCRRSYYWVHQYRRMRGPELVAALAESTSATASSILPERVVHTVVPQATQQLQAPPALCLAHCRNRYATQLSRILPHQLPPTTVCLGVQSSNIQSALPGQDPECTAPAGVFLGTLPCQHSSQALPFVWHAFGENDADDHDECPEWTERYLIPQLQQQQAANAHQQERNSSLNHYWKVMIVYATHGASAEVENFLHLVQAQFPHLQIVGGICQGGFVSRPHHTAQNWNTWSSHDLVAYLRTMGITVDARTTRTKADLIQLLQNAMSTRPYYMCHVGEHAQSRADHGEGIFGVVLGGDIPVETVVSRGVESIITKGPATPTSEYVIHEAAYLKPHDEAYMFNSGPNQDGLPPYHLIRSIRHCHTGKIETISSWTQRYATCDLVGLRHTTQDDGFCLHSPHPLSRNVGGFLLFQDGTLPLTSLQDYEIDLYELDGPACRKDVHQTLQALQHEVANQKLLGGCMFSCAARGPAPGMMGERMADATAWSKHFPTVPLLGFYAGGEVGPQAMAGRKHALRGRDATQRATLQGFTAVFALWIVPVVDWSNMHLDDAAETVQEFCRQALMGQSPRLMET